MPQLFVTTRRLLAESGWLVVTKIQIPSLITEPAGQSAVEYKMGGGVNVAEMHTPSFIEQPDGQLVIE